MKSENLRTEANVMDIVSNEARFSTLNDAIRLADLGLKFVSTDNCTLFAPTNAAFEKLPQAVMNGLLNPTNQKYLRQIVLLHLVPVSLRVEDLKRVAAIRTVGGQELLISVSTDHQNITLGNARVLLPSDLAKNGVLYPLDEILLPAAAQRPVHRPIMDESASRSDRWKPASPIGRGAY